MLDIEKLMKELAGYRPVFHSEADFQHALAWCIHTEKRNHMVRLEYRPIPRLSMYLDLWLPTVGVAVELKYRTRELDIEVSGESFELRNQAAKPPSRYSFLKDIQRLEHLVSRASNVRSGLAVMLTNDAGYWHETPRGDLVDMDFHIHHGRRLTGEMTWSDRATPGTKKSREEPIRLNGVYDLQWRDYATMESGRNAKFRYLAVQVHGDNRRVGESAIPIEKRI